MRHCAQVCLGFLALVSQPSLKASLALPAPGAGKHGFRQAPIIYNVNNYLIPNWAYLLLDQSTWFVSMRVLIDLYGQKIP